MPKPETANQLIAEYDEVLQIMKKRHISGQEKYGEFSFLNRDMREDSIEELIDAMNYLLYLIIKIKYFKEK